MSSLIVTSKPQSSLYCRDVSSVQGKCHSFIGSCIQGFSMTGYDQDTPTYCYKVTVSWEHLYKNNWHKIYIFSHTLCFFYNTVKTYNLI